jgi:hypothetical protein
MKHNLILLSIATSLLVSCAGGLKPSALTSTPPVKAIKLESPAEWGDGFILKKYTFPVGVYTPKSEDKEGFYFQAPGSLTVNDSFLKYGATGGLYLRKDQASPDQMYVLAPFGNAMKISPKNSPLKTTLIK